MTLEQRQRRLADALASSWTDANEEREIVTLVRETPDSELSPLLASISLERLTRAVDDHVLGPKNRTALLELLTVTRLEALAPELRAELIMALQEGRTGPAAEQGLVNVLVGTRGPALVQLKDRLDHRDSYHNLHRLIYRDLDQDHLQARALAHLAAEVHPTGALKVLSDIDDTLYANWKDGRYPKGTVYPGVRAFYRELLGRGPNPGGLVFLTARPGDRLGIVEDRSLEHVRGRGLERVSLLPGEWDKLHSNEAIAEGKYRNFVRYSAMYPEYDLVWVGDSGQGDALLARRLMAGHRDRVRATFIHDVVDTPEERRAEWRRQGVCFFDTYVGATAIAASLGLLDPAAIDRVHEAAERELAEVDFERRADRVALETAMASERTRTH